MFGGDTYNTTRTAEVEPPVAQLCLASAALALVLGVASSMTAGSAVISLVVFAVFVGFLIRGLRQSYPHDVLGLCNVVTLTRTAMVAFLAGAVLAPAVNPWLMFSVASLAFSLDGVDGWLARRSGLTSRFGARFDMETDALLGAVLATWLLASGKTGPEILVLGFMRYAFCLAGFLFPALQADLPASFRRKAICVVQIGALIALLFPLTPEIAVAPVSFLAAVLLTWSFLVDVNWLLRRTE
ncbi:MAG: CDP-alcohol phosphatidyltransferase family protein [Ruegeria sp.]